MMFIVFLVGLAEFSCHTKSDEQRARQDEQHPKSDEQKIVDSFQQEVSAEVAEIERHHKCYGGSTGPCTFDIDVEKTTSLVSPYIGVANISAAPRRTLDAETNGLLRDITRHKLTYAYQNAHWILKSEECYKEDFAWGTCSKSRSMIVAP
jgi:hypothetical protein